GAFVLACVTVRDVLTSREWRNRRIALRVERVEWQDGALRVAAVLDSHARRSRRSREDHRSGRLLFLLPRPLRRQPPRPARAGRRPAPLPALAPRHLSRPHDVSGRGERTGAGGWDERGTLLAEHTR